MHVPDHIIKAAREGLVKQVAPALAAVESEISKADASKPPSGYVAIPGGQHGGYRKQVGGKWRYWYPDEASARAAIEHHNTQYSAARKKGSEAENVAMYGPPSVRSQKYSERDQHYGEARQHEQHAEGARKFIVDKEVNEHLKARKKEAKDAEKKRDAAGVTTESPEGKHRVATTGGEGHKLVDTVHRKGDYAVHSTGITITGAHAHTVTHVPSGMSLGDYKKKDAVALANHMHEHAGDAGKDAKFGHAPDKAAMGKMGDAFKKFRAQQAAGVILHRGGFDLTTPDVLLKAHETTRVGSCEYIDRGPVVAPMQRQHPSLARDVVKAVPVATDPTRIEWGDRSESGRLVRPGSSYLTE